VATGPGRPQTGVWSFKTRYTIVHVRKDGRWLRGSARDAIHMPPSNYDYLRGLEEAIDDWAGESENGEVERLPLVWMENQDFITGTFATTLKHFSLGKMKV
jgi:hypothetical protein